MNASSLFCRRLVAAAFALCSPVLWAQTASLAARLQPFVDDHTIAGAVTLVASKEKILDLSAVGLADLAAKKPMATDSIFWIASMSKPITATALMMLVDEGKVSVDDPVEKYLPEFKGEWMVAEAEAGKQEWRHPKHPILIRNILSHTSGLPAHTAVEQPTLDLLPLATAVRSYTIVPLMWEPDSQYKYSNAGINTAGQIIEAVSGMPYEQFLQRRIFDPLKMKDTTFWPDEKQVERIAKSYKPSADKTGLEETPISQLRYPLNDREHRFPMPAGGLFSTATDVARFCQMVLNGGEFEGHRYLSEAAVQQMTSRQTPAGLEQSYGFGWAPGGNGFAHGGAYSTMMSVDTKHNLVTVFMVQVAGWRNKEENGKVHSTFQKAASEEFGK